MGSGGVRSSCQSTLCILGSIALGLGLLCLICGLVLYGVSTGFTKIANAHIGNPDTSSNFTKSVDSKLDNARSKSARTGEDLLKKAHQMFYTTGGLGVGAVVFFILSCVVAYKSQPALAPPITSDPFAPDAEVEDPSAPPGEDEEGGATSPVPPAGSPLPPGSPPPPPVSPVPDRAASPVV